MNDNPDIKNLKDNELEQVNGGYSKGGAIEYYEVGGNVFACCKIRKSWLSIRTNTPPEMMEYWALRVQNSCMRAKSHVTDCIDCEYEAYLQSIHK